MATTNPAAPAAGFETSTGAKNGFVDCVKGHSAAATMDHRNIATIESLEAKLIHKTMVSRLNERLKRVKTSTDEADSSNTNSKSSF